MFVRTRYKCWYRSMVLKELFTCPRRKKHKANLHLTKRYERIINIINSQNAQHLFSKNANWQSFFMTKAKFILYKRPMKSIYLLTILSPLKGVLRSVRVQGSGGLQDSRYKILVVWNTQHLLFTLSFVRLNWASLSSFSYTSLEFFYIYSFENARKYHVLSIDLRS